MPTMSSNNLQAGLESNESMKDGLRDQENGLNLQGIEMNPQKKVERVPPQEVDAQNFTIKIYKSLRIRICKPLIPLKLVLFFWYGGGSFIIQFLTIYFKQRGMTLSELSTGFILTPICQFLGTTLSGVAADKIGRSKPVIVVNLILVIVFLSGILCIPTLNNPSCIPQPINLRCQPQQFDWLITKNSCDVDKGLLNISSCDVKCPENITDFCDEQNFICETFAKSESHKNFSLPINVNGTHKVKYHCYYNESFMYHENLTYSWCKVPHKMNCNISCGLESGDNCSDDSDNRKALLITTMILFILFQAAYSNCYRILDVTSMSLVKQHNSDFGHERFFCNFGTLVVSPIAGYLVDASSRNGLEKNNIAALYFFIFIVLIILGIVYKLEIKINPPGKKMGKKAVYLLKNTDVLVFILVVLVLGSTYSFHNLFMFWYLEGMNTPSILKGLIPAAGALYGLPFLLTSRWWVNKIGASRIFVLSLLGHVVSTFGYSFLNDPWYALILEASNILTYDLAWVAVVLHSHELAPEGLTATVISLAGSIHYQIGKASGSAIGGFVMAAFNGRVAYRVMGIICLISAVLYAFYLYIRQTCFSRGLSADTVTASQSKSVSMKATNL